MQKKKTNTNINLDNKEKYTFNQIKIIIKNYIKLNQNQNRVIKIKSNRRFGWTRNPRSRVEPHAPN